MGTGEGQPQPAGLVADRRWTFGPAVLDERSLELSVGGEPVRLERKPLEVLLYLLHHAGEVVTKEELAENLWPGRILTESVLTRCISQLRQALKDDDRTMIRTIHGFGYRLVAEVKVDACTALAPPAFAFNPGDHPPLRPQWRLVERLGTGGNGDAWLARHDKTHEARVFKFALDHRALASLKREITLYRLMAESLGDRAPVVRIYEWNLEEAPYFIETEYVPGRDLRAWADAQGGLPGIPLELRLELIAQIADALAAAHSVGVLHKDLKPGNVLIATDAAGRPQVKLSDFGSGGVLDVTRLEGLGITKLGFTAAAASHDTGGTPLYLAPEVIAGQPFTVAADVYAMGVMLYQLVVGDLRKAVALGWELNVADDLLREDIALTAAGDPARRLADAGRLAELIRSIPIRREARAAEIAGRERSERTRRALAELRRTRVFATALLVLVVAAVVGGMTAHRARNDAIAARATAEAVNDFLIDDVLSVDPATERPRNASYESLLARAASQVGTRFRGQPDAAAMIHWLLGRRFHEVGRTELAGAQYERAAALLEFSDNGHSLPALLALERLVPIYQDQGLRARASTSSVKLLEAWGSRYGRRNLSTLLLRARLARRSAFMGQLAKAEAEFQAVLAELPNAHRPHEETKSVLREWLGITLTVDTGELNSEARVLGAVRAYVRVAYAAYLAEFAERYRDSLQILQEESPVVSRLYGEDSELTASVHLALALSSATMGDGTGAWRHAQRAGQYFNSALPPIHCQHGVTALLMGRIALALQEPKRAAVEIERARTKGIEAGCSPRILQEIQYELGRAYEELGRIDESIELYRGTLGAYELLQGPDHVGCLKRRLSLADALRRSGSIKDASATVNRISSAAITTLPPDHLIVAELKRIEGHLLMAQGRKTAGRTLLTHYSTIVEGHFGRNHWRTRRARAELATAMEP